MKIAYLLADTELAGGIRVALAHADILTDRGHEVTLVTKGGPLTWRQSRARWLHVAEFHELDAAPYDFVVGTFWTTLRQAWELAGERAVHFCQGFEGSFTAYQPIRAQIEEAYRLPLPKITVSPHLVPVCRAFYDDATYVGQIVDDEFYADSLLECGDEVAALARPLVRLQNTSRSGGSATALQNGLRVLLVGPAQADFKGIDVGYEAVRHARALGARFELIRASQWPAAEGEPVELASEFHVAIPTREMVRLFASCDVFLGPSRAEEGFGLPAAEAMAGGVPAVLSEIPSFLSWDERHDYALFAPEGDARVMGEQLARLAGDASLREQIAKRGREVAEQFRAEKTGERLEAWFSARARTRTSGR
jgi:glycosyltransferase involved in cell wall biosynthesis